MRDARARSGEPSAFAALDPLPSGNLVAVGGRLDPDLVLDAYRHGLFPWNDADEPVLWWSPDPRALLPLDGLHVSRRLGRTLRDRRWSVTRNRAFATVMQACSQERPEGTWIHPDMLTCYLELHARGVAHSLEVCWEGALVGGVYGVAVGGLFAAESMFHRRRDASKVALVHLVAHLRARGFEALDVQFETPHLARMGARSLPRAQYLEGLARWRESPVRFETSAAG